MRHYIILPIICLLTTSSVLGHVGLTYPAGGETFNAGDTINIEWQVEIEHGDNNWDLYFSSDGGSNWSEIALNISKSQLEYEWTVPEYYTSEGKIIVIQDNAVGTDYQSESNNFSITATTTGVTDNNNQVKEFFVYPAYPNPFNNSTVLSFNLPEQSYVRLNVFNIAGQKIKTLINSEMEPGVHKISWNADNVPSGVYFYIIETKYSPQTRKVILLK